MFYHSGGRQGSGRIRYTYLKLFLRVILFTLPLKAKIILLAYFSCFKLIQFVNHCGLVKIA